MTGIDVMNTVVTDMHKLNVIEPIAANSNNKICNGCEYALR
jgi:hypothetical protein